MCGRFYVDDDTAREIERTIRKVDEKLKKSKMTGDIHPTEMAAVISDKNGELVSDAKKWGFPGFANQKVIINARAESVLEKKMFCDSVLKRRIVIPAAGFYEWNKAKEKVRFTAWDSKQSILYMAGFYDYYENEERFVILTTNANDSMQDVHDRMPLILKPQEIEAWIHDNRMLETFLHKVPDKLRKHVEYEQQTLFGLI